MSVFEPGAEADHHSSSDQPQFRVSVRGYDRQEVAAYIQDLWSHIENERQRAEQAERTIAQMKTEISSSSNRGQTPTFEHLGIEAAKVLEQAGQSAEMLVEEAESRARSIVDQARAQAAELIAVAERRAEQTRSSAAEDAQRTLEEARETAERIRQEVQDEGAEAKARTERMQSLHDSLLEHLGRVRQDLSTLLGLPDERAASPAGEEPAEARREPEAEAEPAAKAETQEQPAAKAETQPAAEAETQEQPAAKAETQPAAEAETQEQPAAEVETQERPAAGEKRGTRPGAAGGKDGKSAGSPASRRR